MGQYLPYSNTHSIQEAVIGVHFHDKSPSEAVRRAQEIASVKLKSAFPQSNELYQQVQEIKIDRIRQGAISQEKGPPRLAGFELSRTRADARPARVLRFLENILTVHFLEYQNWQTTLTDSLQYINTVLSPLPLATNPVMAFSLRYIDRYTFDGPHNEPRADMLLREGNTYMAPRCFDGGPLWHCHSGWFETYDANSRILNQLNVSSAIVDQVPTVTIDHNAICQLGVPRQSIESIIQPAAGNAGLKDALDYLHAGNSEILRNMLSAEMLDKIGLQT